MTAPPSSAPPPLAPAAGAPAPAPGGAPAPRLRLELAAAGDAGRLGPGWDALYRDDPEAQLFLCRPYMAPLVRANAAACRLLAVWRGEALEALMPLRFGLDRDARTGAFSTRLMMPGTLAWADYTGLLARPEREAEAIPALAEALMSLGWGVLRLRNLRMGARRRALLLGPFEAAEGFSVAHEREIVNGGTTDNHQCPRIALPDSFDAYLGALGRNTRATLRRLLRRLDAGEFTVREGTGPDDAAMMAEMWTRLWRARKGARAEALGRDAAEILSAGLASGLMAMPVLERDGRPLGALAHYVDPARREVLFFLSARETDVEDVPVGLLMHAHSIRAAIEAGAKVYDFLRGDERYKLQLGATPTPIGFPIVTRTARGAGPRATLDPVSVPQVLRRLPRMIDNGEADAAKAALRQVAAVLEG